MFNGVTKRFRQKQRRVASNFGTRTYYIKPVVTPLIYLEPNLDPGFPQVLHVRDGLVPERIEFLESMPLTKTGKVDKRFLRKAIRDKIASV